MQLALFNILKAKIETITAIKHVALWNNQFERENIEIPFNYPCCFIEFTDINYIDRLNGVQNCSMSVNLHLGFESYKTEDTDILSLKQTLNSYINMLSTNKTTKMLRRSEIQNFDHTNIQEYIIGYEVTGIDESTVNLPDTNAQVDTLVLNSELIIDNTIIRTGTLE